jgi:eukaryotic-like serine/threonine-protein kinase
MDAVGPGSKLAGRYVVEEHLASGGMATVWRARDEVLARVVAVKILRLELATNPEFRERFRREAVASARLNHPAIINVFDTGSDGDSVFIVMELFSSRTLAGVLRDQGPLETAQAVDVVIPVLEALAYAHDHGIVHRDIKPANILVANDGLVKVTDFGIAKAVQSWGDLTTTGNVLGTAQYLSPEQIHGGDVDGRSDLYSLGVVLYEALTGRPPFDAETPVATAMLRLTSDPVPPRDIRPGVPRHLEAAVLRALARRPEDRFTSAGAMRAALDRWGDGRQGPATEPVRAPAPPPAAPGRGSTFRSWMLVPLALVAVAAVVIAAGLMLGRLQLGGRLGVQSARQSSADAGTAARIVRAQDWDPFGDGSEHPADVGLAIDGKAGTSWSTSQYSTADFGRLKPGLGLWLELGGEVTVSQIEVTSPLSGWTFELRPGARPNENADPIASTDGNVTFTVRGGTAVVNLPPVKLNGVMIWITRLAPAQAGFAAAVDEVIVKGPA